jgi:hypothetical protein
MICQPGSSGLFDPTRPKQHTVLVLRDDANGQGKNEHDNNDYLDRDRNTDHDITPVSTAGAPAEDSVHRRSPADVPPSVTHRCWASCRDLSTVSFGRAIASKSATVDSLDGCAAVAKMT